MTLTAAELAAVILVSFMLGAVWAFPMAKRRAELKIERRMDDLEDGEWWNL
jgi:hypothetical protein